MSESYEQNRVSYESFANMSSADKMLDERFPFKWNGGDGLDFTDFALKVLEERYDSLCDTEERTEFWRHWCLEHEGKLLLPDYEMNDGEYLLRPYLEWIRENIFALYTVPETMMAMMLGEVCAEVLNSKRGEYPQWVVELEERWGAYQEELGYKKKCALCPEPLDDKYGNNTFPLGKSGDRCCNDCNTDKVLPLRLRG